MLRTPVILGISMAARKNRRLLVAATYAPLLAFTVTLVLIPSWGKHLGSIWVGAGNACFLVSWGVFSRLVKQLGPLDLRGGRDDEPRLGS